MIQFHSVSRIIGDLVFFLTMGSTETLEDIVISPNSQDSVSINSACSGLELRSYSSSVELEFN